MRERPLGVSAVDIGRIDIEPHLIVIDLRVGQGSRDAIPERRDPFLSFGRQPPAEREFQEGGPRVEGLRRAGWRPLALGGALWLAVASSSLALQGLTGRL